MTDRLCRIVGDSLDRYPAWPTLRTVNWRSALDSSGVYVQLHANLPLLSQACVRPVGSDLLPAAIPEARLPVQKFGSDLDDDGITEPSDNCPAWAYPSQTIPSWGIQPNDPDCDGVTSASEGSIGTDPNDPCPNTSMANDEADDRWPSDFDDNKVVNITDVFNVLPPYFGSSAANPNPKGDGMPEYTARRDLVPDGVINISDVFKMLPPYYGSSCTSAHANPS